MMKKLILLLLVGFINIQINAQQNVGQVVFFQHSLRWLDESNFPYYLKLPDMEQKLMAAADERLKQKFNLTSVSWPSSIDYRVIKGFGKAKISWPASSSSAKEVAWVSALSRDATGFGVLWSMELIVRDRGELIYQREIKHELLPVSYSCYLTKQRWLEQEEFLRLFVKLFDELLDLSEPLPKSIEVGSIESIAFKINDLMPVDSRYTLSVSGSMLTEGNAVYQLRNDSGVIQELKFKDGMNITRVKNPIISGVVNDIIRQYGLNILISAPVREIRLGNLFDANGNKIKFKLSWIGETNPSDLIIVGGVPVNGRELINPIAGEVYDRKNPENVYATYVYYKKINANNEVLSDHNFRLSGSYATLGISDIHFIQGKMPGIDFELIYPEQEGCILININSKPIAALSMFNENKESRSFSGMKLSANKKVATSQNLKIADVNSVLAEKYSLYTIAGVSNENLEDYMKLIALLFFSISQTNAPLSP